MTIVVSAVCCVTSARVSTVGRQLTRSCLSLDTFLPVPTCALFRFRVPKTTLTVGEFSCKDRPFCKWPDRHVNCFTQRGTRWIGFLQSYECFDRLLFPRFDTDRIVFMGRRAIVIFYSRFSMRSSPFAYETFFVSSLRKSIRNITRSNIIARVVFDTVGRRFPPAALVGEIFNNNENSNLFDGQLSWRSTQVGHDGYAILSPSLTAAVRKRHIVYVVLSSWNNTGKSSRTGLSTFRFGRGKIRASPRLFNTTCWRRKHAKRNVSRTYW